MINLKKIPIELKKIYTNLVKESGLKSLPENFDDLNTDTVVFNRDDKAISAIFLKKHIIFLDIKNGFLNNVEEGIEFGHLFIRKEYRNLSICSDMYFIRLEYLIDNNIDKNIYVRIKGNNKGVHPRCKNLLKFYLKNGFEIIGYCPEDLGPVLVSKKTSLELYKDIENDK